MTRSYAHPFAAIRFADATGYVEPRGTLSLIDTTYVDTVRGTETQRHTTRQSRIP